MKGVPWLAQPVVYRACAVFGELTEEWGDESASTSSSSRQTAGPRTVERGPQCVLRHPAALVPGS